MVTRQLGPGMFQQYTTTECERCPNVKAETRGEVLEVHVEPGMREGQEIRLREEGEPHPDGEAGDLRFRLRQEPHPRFRREDDDLHFDLPITLTEALVGFSKAIRHLDGHWVEVTESGERAGCRGTPLSSRAAAATSSAARHGQASRRAATPTSGRFTACRDLDFRVPPEQGHNKPGTRSVRGFRGRGRVPRVQSRHRPGTLLWRFQRSSGASRPAHALARGFEY